MLQRTTVYAAFFIVLPVMILWLILPYFDPTRIVSETPKAAPQWVEDGRHYSTCDEAMSGTPMPDSSVLIGQERAARIGAGVIETQTTLSSANGGGIVVFHPSLVSRTFADGQARLAWVYGQGRMTDKYSMMGIADFVYIDAKTGDPLLLIKDMFVGDPNFTCSALSFPQGILQKMTIIFYGIVITIAYLLVASITVIIVLRRTAPSEDR